MFTRTRPRSLLLLIGVAFALSCRASGDEAPQKNSPGSNSLQGSVPATAPSTAPADADAEVEYRDLTAAIGGERVFKGGVYTITLPRADLWVQAEMGDIPTSAGIESRFHFFRCTCGKGKVVGEFCLADYETNDVIDALRAGHLDVVSIAPMLMNEKPRLTALRFQGEGDTAELAKTIKSALEWVGEARTAPQRVLPKPEAAGSR